MTAGERRDALDAILIADRGLNWAREWAKRLTNDDRRELIGSLLRAGTGQEAITLWQNLCEQVDGETNG